MHASNGGKTCIELTGRKNPGTNYNWFKREGKRQTETERLTEE